MEFLILNKGQEKTVDSIQDGLRYMADNLKATVAQHNDETGLNFSMMMLSVGETLIAEDGNGDEILVKRIK